MRTMEGNYVEIEIKYDMFPDTFVARVISEKLLDYGITNCVVSLIVGLMPSWIIWEGTLI